MFLAEIKRHVKRFLKRMALSNRITRSLYNKRRSRLDNNIRQDYHNLGPEVARRVDQILAKEGIDVWLYAGSLLGVVRDGDFLAWDDDLDLCVLENDSFNWDAIENSLTEAGFEKIREFTCNGVVTEQAYAFGNSHFDIFALKPTGDGCARVYIYSKLDDVWYDDQSQYTVLFLDTVQPLGKEYINVQGHPLPVPSNSEEILMIQYGTDWRVPNPNYVDGSTYHVLEGAEGKTTLSLR